MATAVADARTYHTGPRGGCYYYNSNGNKTYTEHYKCRDGYSDLAPVSRTKTYTPPVAEKSYTIQRPRFTAPQISQPDTSAIPAMTAKQKQKYTQAQWETLQSHKSTVSKYKQRSTQRRASLLNRYNRSHYTPQTRQQSAATQSSRTSRYTSYRKRPTLQRVRPTAVRPQISKPATSKAIPNTYTAEVVRIIDGDTFEANVGGKLHKIRLMGVDTPESKKRGTPVECYAKEAEQKLADLIGGKTIALKLEGIPYGMYGRIVGYAEVDGVDVGQMLISEGYAEAYTKFPFERMEQYKQAEDEARNADKGLWGSACN